LNLHGRALLVRRVVVDQRPVSHVAKELGISRQCAHRWVARYRLEGVAGLLDRSSRPRSCPSRTPVEVEAAVIAARLQARCGPAGITRMTGVPERTVTRILRRHQVPRLVECDPLTGQLIRASKTTAVRYERATPGDLIHVDVKKIGRIPDGGGWRARGRQGGRTSVQKKARIGFDYVHSAVDDHTRLAFTDVLADEKGPTCARFLAQAAAYFAAHGIPVIRQVMTDNHWSYTRSTALAAHLEAMQARHVLIKPHCPLAERQGRTLQPNPASRMGLPASLHHQRRPHRSPGPLAGLLQH
jgi:transposase-like protein